MIKHLICLSISVLLSENIFAQSNSSLVLQYHVYASGPGCNCTVWINNVNGSPTSVTCGMPYLQIQSTDSSSPLVTGEYYHTNDFTQNAINIAFTLDTVDYMLRHVVIWTWYKPYCGGGALPLSGSDKEEVTMTITTDSVPYSGNLLDTISADQSFLGLCKDTVMISASGRYTNYSGDTDCSYQVSGILSLKLYNTFQSQVHTNLGDASGTLDLQYSNERFVAMFSKTDYFRSLEISDVLGRKFEAFTIPANSTTFALPPLCPGLYFAHLGDKVVKFIVK